MHETWKELEEIPGYSLSNLGRVKRIYIMPQSNQGRYKIIGLAGKKNKQFLISRLVAEAFIGKIPSGKLVHHKDENRDNNATFNLEIITHKEHIKIHLKGKGKYQKLGVIPPSKTEEYKLARYLKYRKSQNRYRSKYNDIK